MNKYRTYVIFRKKAVEEYGHAAAWLGWVNAYSKQRALSKAANLYGIPKEDLVVQYNPE